MPADQPRIGGVGRQQPVSGGGDAIRHVQGGCIGPVQRLVVVYQHRIVLPQDVVAWSSVGSWRVLPHHDAVVAGIGHTELAAPMGNVMRPAHAQCRWRATGIFIAAGEVVLTQHQVGGLSTGGGQAAPHQYAPVAAIGHPQPRTVPKHAIRPEQALAAGRIGAAIGQRARKIGLPQHQIGRHVVITWQLAPDQNAVVPRVGHRQTLATGGHAGGNIERSRRRLALGVAPFVPKVGLADNPVGRCVVSQRQSGPAQQPMVSGIADPQRAIDADQTGAARTEQRSRVRRDRYRQTVPAHGPAQTNRRPASIQQSRRRTSRPGLLERRWQTHPQGTGRGIG